MNQPGKVANPAGAQLNRKCVLFLVLVCLEFGLARQIQLPSRPASACSIYTLRLNLVLTRGIPPALRNDVHLFIPPTAIGSVQSWSCHAVACRCWSLLPQGRWRRTSTPQDNSSNDGCCLFRYHHRPLVRYIYERNGFVKGRLRYPYRDLTAYK